MKEEPILEQTLAGILESFAPKVLEKLFFVVAILIPPTQVSSNQNGRNSKV